MVEHDEAAHGLKPGRQGGGRAVVDKDGDEAGGIALGRQQRNLEVVDVVNRCGVLMVR